MMNALIIRGRFDGKNFVPAEPLPAPAGEAELIVYTPVDGACNATLRSIFDLFGKAHGG